ncbi:MAG: polyprenyl synthetase family protein [Clostridia bacterium]|nr:polyprenyl synthetase family protein [Clostridia bacterium]
MSFINTLENYQKKINSFLEEYLSGKKGELYDAVKYSLLAGGKRIRPVLALAVCDALEGDNKKALVFGTALEMIHTYSLIHDDLPCMDNDDFRRGKPTNHKVFGEATAVLSGDALLNMACELITEAGFDAKITVEALRIIYTSSGAEGMVGGQMLDMKAEKVSLNEDELYLLHKKKTGALIDAAASLGAICAEKDKDLLKGYSASLGIAFQIRDDILDVDGDEISLGKPVNSDEKNNKVTFVTLYGIGGAQNKLMEETQNAIDSLEFLGEKGKFLKELALYLLNRES